MPIDTARYGRLTPDIVKPGDHFIFATGGMHSVPIPLYVKELRSDGDRTIGFIAAYDVDGERSIGSSFSFYGEPGCKKPAGYLVKLAGFVYISDDWRDFLEGKVPSNSKQKGETTEVQLGSE